MELRTCDQLKGVLDQEAPEMDASGLRKLAHDRPVRGRVRTDNVLQQGRARSRRRDVGWRGARGTALH